MHSLSYWWRWYYRLYPIYWKRRVGWKVQKVFSASPTRPSITSDAVQSRTQYLWTILPCDICRVSSTRTCCLIRQYFEELIKTGTIKEIRPSERTELTSNCAVSKSHFLDHGFDLPGIQSSRWDPWGCIDNFMISLMGSYGYAATLCRYAFVLKKRRLGWENTLLESRKKRCHLRNSIKHSLC